MDKSIQATLHQLATTLLVPEARPVFITGAGISLASGIPTFRGSEPGAVWAKNVTELGTRRFFKTNPVAAWKFYLHRFDTVRAAEPNAAHIALAELEVHLPALTLITQNVDGLHIDAGSKNLVEIHGSSRRMRCTRRECVNSAPLGVMKWDDSYFTAFRSAPSMETLPRCPLCRKPMRPHILWFDEYYASHEDYGLKRLHQAWYDWTVLVFVGTSHSVGVTEQALEAAGHDRITAYNIDPNPAQSDDTSSLIQVTANAEVVLPRLLRLVQQLKSTQSRQPSDQNIETN